MKAISTTFPDIIRLLLYYIYPRSSRGFTIYKRQLLSPSHKDCVFKAIRFLDGKKYELYAVVVLDDHVHIVINPEEALSKIMRSIKSFTVHEINRIANKERQIVAR